MPLPSPSSPTRTATTANHVEGDVPAADSPVNAATPVIEPTMSMAYARSGGMDVRREPSGIARPAMITVASTTRTGKTRKLTSARVFSARPKKISSGERSWMPSWTCVTRTATASSSGPKGEIAIRR